MTGTTMCVKKCPALQNIEVHTKTSTYQFSVMVIKPGIAVVTTEQMRHASLSLEVGKVEFHERQWIAPNTQPRSVSNLQWALVACSGLSSSSFSSTACCEDESTMLWRGVPDSSAVPRSEVAWINERASAFREDLICSRSSNASHVSMKIGYSTSCGF